MVSPYIGEWIEIHLQWTLQKWQIVSPYIGEWIEIMLCHSHSLALSVSPYIGEWIEIEKKKELFEIESSHLT